MEDDTIQERLRKSSDWKRADNASKVTDNEIRTRQVHQTMPEDSLPVTSESTEKKEEDDDQRDKKK
jgi:hypothetical protein